MGAISDATDPQAATPEDVSPLDVSRDEPETSPIQLTTTDEAKSWARRALTDYYDNTRTGERSLAKDAETSAAAAKAALRAAQQRLMQDPYAPNPQELAYRQGAALMDPGRSGRPSEGLRSYFGEMATEQAAERERQAGLASQSLGYQNDISGIDAKLLETKRKLLDMQEKNASTLAKQGLQTLGRSVAKDTTLGGQKPLSPEGKQALDELGPDAVFTDASTGKTDFTPLYHKRVAELVQAKVEDAHARAGTDETELKPEERLKVADNAGVPAMIASPYDGMSTRQKLQLQRVEANKAAPAFTQYGNTDNMIRDQLSQIDHFLDINKNTHTGPELAGLPLPGVSAGPHGASIHGGEGWSLNPIGYIKRFDPNIQDMDKITSNLLTTMQKPGFSRVTNYDLQTFARGMMGIDKPFSVNKDISVPLKVWGQNQLDWHEFVQNYFQLHHTIQGAEQSWNDYLNHNPIFDPSKPGTYSLNPNRMDWKEYFRARNHGSPVKSAPVPQSAPIPPSRSGMIDRSATAAASPLTPPGQIPGTDVGAPPMRAPAWQPADEQPAVEPHAEGGRVGYDDGGDVQDPSQLESMLQALRAGASMHLSQGKENPHTPATNFTGEALGGAGTVATLLALARLRGRLGRGAASAGRYVQEHPNLAAVGAGATSGAVSGAATAQPGDSIGNALAYGANGALLGLPARYGIGAAARRLQALTERMRGMPAIGSGDRRTVDAIERDMRQSGGANWDDLSDMMRDDRKLKVPSTLGESVGPSTTGLAKVGLSRDTEAGRNYGDQLEARQAGAGERVTDKTNQALAPDNYLQQTQKLKDDLYSNAAPLYEQAYQAFPAVKSQALNDLMNTPAGQEAASRAFIKMRNKQRPIGAPNALGMVQSPSLEYLDNVKRSLDDMIIREEGTGANYQATDDGRILRGMRDKLKAEVDQATQLPNGQPGPYQQARQQYGGDLEVMDALRSGREDFKKMTPDELRAAISQMSFAEKDALRSGVAEGLFSSVGNTVQDQNPAKKLVSAPYMQEKLTALFDNPKDAGKYLAGLQREAEMFDASKPLLSAANKGQQEAATPSSLATVARSRLMTEKTANDISANMSTSAMDPRANEKIQRLRDAADRLRSRDSVSNTAGVAGAAGIAGAYAPSQMATEDQQ